MQATPDPSRAFAPLPQVHAVRAVRARRDELIAGWLFVLPAITLLFVFVIWPMLASFGLSFTNYQILSPARLAFMGAANYTDILRDTNFWAAIRNTASFAALVVPVQTALALALALLLNLKIPLRSFFRTAYFSPVVMSMTVVSILWSYFYNPSQGMFNQILSHIGLPKQPFLTSAHQAMLAIAVMSIWQGVGFQMLIFLAGLQEISPSLYEAAALDGANRWETLRSITIPQLQRTTYFVLIVTTIAALKLFTQVYVMTKGGPFGSTRTMVYLLWEEGFSFHHTAYASALAVLIFLLILVITLVQRKLVPQDT